MKGSIDPSDWLSKAGWALLAALWTSCAGQAPPPGGPTDTVPPRVIRTFPDTNATGVRPERIEIEFSEYVDRRSVEESIFISPFVGDIEFDWSGTEVAVSFAEPIRDSITYVVSVGTDVTDIRGGNRMATGFSLAFSTGSAIDRGEISGRVHDEKPEGIMVYAYALRGIARDTLNPSRTKPDYITQTGRGGVFRLSNLALGEYRLYALDDAYRNLLYEKEADRYGVAAGDVRLDSTSMAVSDVQFRLSREDTTKPFLVSASAPNRRTIMLRFSEDMDSSSYGDAFCAVQDTVGGASLPVLSIFPDRRQRSVAGVLAATLLDSPAVYRVTVRGIRDRVGNFLDSLNATAVLPGTLQPDTAKPEIDVLGMRDSTRGVPFDRPLQIQFSLPVHQPSFAGALRLLDTLGRELRKEMQWLTPVDLLLVPREPLVGNCWYHLRIVMDSVVSQAGRGYRDSIRVIRFQTLDPRSTGVVTGTVSVAGGAPEGASVYVLATQLESGTRSTHSLRLVKGGHFGLDRLVEGRYSVSSFLDADRSGAYSFGKPFPFQTSERFAVFPDTIKVRARWSVENVNLLIR